MKKYIALFTFVCVLFLGLQTATAQETPEIKAKYKTMALEKSLELTTPQVKQIYAIYLAYEKGDAIENPEGLNIARKKISELLQPKQRHEFEKSFAKEKARQEKIKSVRG
ncbi:hypothetical protein IMCC3317_21370 [Kordia antarctica]|uniref:Uncharacterized protein n=1 Tax=Kordia antarctica TaxID=1218801 RepID=A0A7L4ZJX0_9FLAO|nr:hypothetical protein [Kordia antarctica]QHI36767.1 hypothetical protein IMCC3317_21370 [Kordia antarctica]